MPRPDQAPPNTRQQQKRHSRSSQCSLNHQPTKPQRRPISHSIPLIPLKKNQRENGFYLQHTNKTPPSINRLRNRTRSITHSPSSRRQQRHAKHFAQQLLSHALRWHTESRARQQIRRPGDNMRHRPVSRASRNRMSAVALLRGVL
jgi:hypothetical protein